MRRRTFLMSVPVAVAFSGAVWHEAAASISSVSAGASPYGPLGAPDANGMALPSGFTGRVVARSGRLVGGTLWHPAPDGGACFADGAGWIYVSNSEVPLIGGASAIKFRADGSVERAYRILSGTNINCAGGATSWQTWLSCEEIFRGRVYETYPLGGEARARPAMGRFKHEAAACDPDHRVIYLTEDESDGCFYRFTPTTWGDLSSGRLDVLCGLGGDAVEWRQVPDSTPGVLERQTRHQVAAARHFNGGEGCHYAAGVCYFTAKGDRRVWAYDTAHQTVTAIYDGTGTLDGVDNITGRPSGDLYVAEDGGNMEINIITPDGFVAPIMRLDGHASSEITGPAFSPDGTRLYFSSQRGTSGESAGTGGITYEVTGPFRS